MNCLKLELASPEHKWDLVPPKESLVAAKSVTYCNFQTTGLEVIYQGDLVL